MFTRCRSDVNCSNISFAAQREKRSLQASCSLLVFAFYAQIFLRRIHSRSAWRTASMLSECFQLECFTSRNCIIGCWTCTAKSFLDWIIRFFTDNFYEMIIERLTDSLNHSLRDGHEAVNNDNHFDSWPALAKSRTIIEFSFFQFHIPMLRKRRSEIVNCVNLQTLIQFLSLFAPNMCLLNEIEKPSFNADFLTIINGACGVALDTSVDEISVKRDARTELSISPKIYNYEETFLEGTK